MPKPWRVSYESLSTLALLFGSWFV